MKKLLLFCMAICLPWLVSAKTLRVLFIGNSYTYVNNLPDKIAQLANTTQDTLIYESSTPGGYTLEQHSTNSTTLSKIQAGGWDFVVLQEQSQRPSFPESQVIADVYPYAQFLDSLVHEYSPCARTLFYVTWGRKNGDAANCGFYPPLCTYIGMDSLLQLRYTQMAQQNEALLAPVSMVWRALRMNAPAIELYNADESHPALAGTFAAACAFYSVLFEKSPLQTSYTAGLSSSVAQEIKTRAAAVAYDSLDYWKRFEPVTDADFSYTVQTTTATFSNLSVHADTYFWDFGDGQTGTDPNPQHTYAAQGTYTVSLVATQCQQHDTLTQQVQIGTTSINDLGTQYHLELFPVPVQDWLQLQYDATLSVKALYLSDVSGKTRYKSWLPASRLYIGDLPAGVYWLHLDTEKGHIVRKVVK